MLTFAQFIRENDEDHQIAGWMSPSGKAHTFPADEEHEQNHHPGYRRVMKQPVRGYPNHPNDFKTVRHAQERGFVRFGKKTGGIHGNHYFVHYDSEHPLGTKPH